MSRNSRVLLVASAAGLLCACRNDMHNQPKYKPLVESQFFADHRSERPVLDGTVARGHLRLDKARYVGKVNGTDIDYYPIPITAKDLARGQERYDIYCSPCHSRIGNGLGMIVRRGYRQPPSYHIDRLRTAPTGHFFDVITNGFGAMPSYASRVAPDDRWRIIAYIRALQLSQDATTAQVPPDRLQHMQQFPQEIPYEVGPSNARPANPAKMLGPKVSTEGAGPGLGGAAGSSGNPGAQPLTGAGAPALPAGQPQEGHGQKE